MFQFIKFTQDDIDKAKLELILIYGSMKEAAYRWAVNTRRKRKEYTPAQTEAIFQYVQLQSKKLKV